nr:hypothetical protein [uncultured Acidocella sp.]
MKSRQQLFYGGVPVPYTASWSAEEGTLHLAACRWANSALALCQAQHRGIGKPVFGKPHMVRQREVIASGLCDLCGKKLSHCSKVSLSHARVDPHAAEGPAVLQVEPLLHRQCAAICVQHCPSLLRDIENGTLHIRLVQRYRIQWAIMRPESVAEFTGGEAVAAIGHAKVELQLWRGMPVEWLLQGEGL